MTDRKPMLITGATGFLGREVVRQALERGLEFAVFSRPTSDLRGLPAGDYEVRRGDLGDEASLMDALKGIDTLLNLASLGHGHVDAIAAAATKGDVRRAVFISTTAIFTTLDAPSKAERTRAEDVIRSSGLGYTILRPTMIFGTSRDRNMARLVRLVKRWPVIPVLGSGLYLQQPVYVGDVATASLDVLQHDGTLRKAYDVSGARPLTYEDVIQTVARLLGVRRRLLRIPAGPTIAALEAAARLGLRLPIKAEQVERLNEDKAFDHSQATRDFGYRPLTFEAGMRLQLREMGLA
jgi:uncharacterized protein YbjT (DUF2867 family)